MYLVDVGIHVLVSDITHVVPRSCFGSSCFLFPAIQDSLFRQAMGTTSHEVVELLRNDSEHYLESIVPGSVFEIIRHEGGPRHFVLQVKFYKMKQGNDLGDDGGSVDMDDDGGSVDMDLFAIGTAGKSLGGKNIKDERVGTAGKSLVGQRISHPMRPMSFMSISHPMSNMRFVEVQDAFVEVPGEIVQVHGRFYRGMPIGEEAENWFARLTGLH
jgi:hypothetical protein